MFNKAACIVIKSDGAPINFDVSFEEGNAEATRFAVFTTAHVPGQGGIALALDRPSPEAIERAISILTEKAKELKYID